MEAPPPAALGASSSSAAAPGSAASAAPSTTTPIPTTASSSSSTSAPVAHTPATAGAASSSKDAASSSSGAHTPAESKALPQRDKESFNKLQIARAIAKDHIHYAALQECDDRAKQTIRRQRETMEEYRKLKDQPQYKQLFPARRIYGEGYQGYGNGFTEPAPGHRPAIIYPDQKPRPGKRLVPALKFSKKDMAKQAELHEELVPVRLDVEHDKIKLRDTFTWNLHERLIPYETFAQQLIEDMGLKAPVSQHVEQQVIAQIREQLVDFYPMVWSEEDALDPELPYSAYKNDEMRILVKLNITIGQLTLVDQFEWDINNPANSPEEFAACMSRDLSLSGEFTTAIAHCIREQSQLFVKGLFTIGHPFDGRPVEDADLVSAMLPSPLPTVFRPQQQAKEYAPYMYELNEADLERNEVTFSREQRRQKRSVNRRGGPQLPDLKDRQRTIRTLIVSSVLPGAALDVESSRLYKRAAGAGTGRKRPGARDGDSDSSDSDDSAPESPAMHALQGTARTRGIRGAATAAAQRMANLGRSSETPEAATIHHHETRTSRRFNRDARDSSEEPSQLIVTLKVPREMLQSILRGDKRKHLTPARSATPGQRSTSISASTAMKPPLTPSTAPGGLPSKSVTPAISAAQVEKVLAPPPVAGQPFPPSPASPQWLIDELAELKKPGRYPQDKFGAFMRYVSIDPTTDVATSVGPGAGPKPGAQYAFLPRIKCYDCIGKLYTPGPELTCANFEVHLKNKFHREKVDQRLAREAQGSGSGTPQAPVPPSEE